MAAGVKAPKLAGVPSVAPTVPPTGATPKSAHLPLAS
jgi:hypothetical protein